MFILSQITPGGCPHTQDCSLKSASPVTIQSLESSPHFRLPHRMQISNPSCSHENYQDGHAVQTEQAVWTSSRKAAISSKTPARNLCSRFAAKASTAEIFSTLNSEKSCKISSCDMPVNNNDSTLHTEMCEHRMKGRPPRFPGFWVILLMLMLMLSSVCSSLMITHQLY